MPIPLHGPRVDLRSWLPGDAGAVAAACQDVDIQRWTQVPVPYELHHAEEFVTTVAAQTSAEGGMLLAVVARDHGGLVGSIGLFPPSDGVGEIGFWTAPGHRRRGLTAEALDLLTTWALTEHGLHRVELLVEPDNAASHAVAVRADFRREGVVRQRFRHRGRPVDFTLYSRLASDGPAR